MSNQKLICLALGTVLALSTSSFVRAATASFDVSITTIADLTITELQGLDFGSQIFITAGGICTMDAATPGTTNVDYAPDAAEAASNFGLLSGAGCISSTQTPGIYEVTGVSGQAVSITVNSVTGTNFNFNPSSGCITLYDNADDGDSCNTFTPGTAFSGQLAGASDTATGGFGPAPTAGRLYIVVGGQITIGATDLTANTAYTEQFTIDAVY